MLSRRLSLWFSLRVLARTWAWSERLACVWSTESDRPARGTGLTRSQSVALPLWLCNYTRTRVEGYVDSLEGRGLGTFAEPAPEAQVEEPAPAEQAAVAPKIVDCYYLA